MPEMEDFRPIYCQLGYSSKADGSAQLSQGKTTVVAGVFGPVEVKRSREHPDRMDIEVTLQPRVGQSGVQSRSQESIIHDIIKSCSRVTLHPRSGLNLSLHVLEQDSGVVATCINAACLALADSGVAMSRLFSAVSIGLIKDSSNDDSKIVIDPTAKMIRKAEESCLMTFVFESRNREVIATHMEHGKINEAKFQECLGTARKASSNMFEFYREVVKKKFSKEFSEK